MKIPAILAFVLTIVCFQKPMSAAELPNFDRLWNYGDPAATEAKFRALLPPAEAAGNTAYLAELLTQIARSEGLQDKFDAAHATLDRAEKLLTPALQRPRVRYLLERGRVHNSAGKAPSALPLFVEAAVVAGKAGEKSLEVDAVHMVAIAQPTPALQIEWNLKGVALVEQDSAQKGWLYALYNNLGEAYAADRQYEKALAIFRKLLKLDEDKGEEPWIYTQKDIAKMLRLLQRYDDALAILNPIAAKLEKEKKSDGYIDEETAECLLAQDKPDAARPLFARAYQEQSKDPHVVRHDMARLDRLKQLGGL